MTAPRILISNLVYGEPYSSLFSELHLPSLIENVRNGYFSSNSRYLIFTTPDSAEKLRVNVNYQLLQRFIEVEVVVLEGESLNYANRYGVQGFQVNHSAEIALAGFDLFHVACADIYYGESALVDASKKLLASDKNILCHTVMRVALESAAPILVRKKFKIADELFLLAFENPHPLWTSSNVRNPYFSKIPYHLLWTNNSQLLIRAFSIGPFVSRPQPWMTACSGCLDLAMNSHEKEFLWTNDWSEIPVIELQQLSAFYPMFGNAGFRAESVVAWAKASIPERNWDNLKYWQVCKLSTEAVSRDLISESAGTANIIIGGLNNESY